MDYLELNDSAVEALEQLDGGFGPQYVPSKRPIPLPTASRTRRRRRVEVEFLLRLEDLISSPRDIANALGLSTVPRLENGTAEDHEASFCRLSQAEIYAFSCWATKHYPTKNFLKIPIRLAHKDPGKLAVLGHDGTLPHHRPCLPVKPTEQSAPEYPVHYFFYGTLSDPERLGRLFGVPLCELSPLQPATLLDGRLRAWAGKYKAVVDDPGGRVDGWSYVVASASQEHALREYEGDNYEVVAARLLIDGKETTGRTFRFAGYDDDLTG